MFKLTSTHTLKTHLNTHLPEMEMARKPRLDVGVFPAHSQKVSPFIVAATVKSKKESMSMETATNESRIKNVRFL